MDRRRLLRTGLAAALLGPAALPARATPTIAAPSAPARAARPVRVLGFGDSLMAGFGLPEDKGFVPALSRWVADQGRQAQFLNAGLSGDTSYGGRVRIGWALRQQPDAVLVELGANDMLLGFDPQKSARNLEVIIRAAKAGGRPVLLMAIGAVGRDAAYRRGWNAMWPRLAQQMEVPLVPDLYAVIRAQPKQARSAWLQADNLHASEKGVASMVGLAGPAVLALVDQAAARRSGPPAAVSSPSAP